jgi:hypothetical protein
MPPSDLDITRTAHLWNQQHGDATITRAREALQRKHGLRSASCCSFGGNARVELFLADASSHAVETPITG